MKQTVESPVIWDVLMVYAYLVNIEFFWYMVWDITFSANCLSPGGRQATKRTDVDSQSTGPQSTILVKFGTL